MLMSLDFLELQFLTQYHAYNPYQVQAFWKNLKLNFQVSNKIENLKIKNTSIDY